MNPSSTPDGGDYYHSERVIIRPLTADDLFALYTQPAVAAVLPAYRPWLPAGQLAMLADRLEWLAQLDPPLEVEALVLHRVSNTPLGFLCLSGIDLLNGKAEFSVAFFRGRGSRAALEAMHWAIDVAFSRFDLYKMLFYRVPGNMPAATLLDHMDIRVEALLREEICLAEGDRSDLLRYALFCRDWLAGDLRKLLQRLVPLTPQ